MNKLIVVKIFLNHPTKDGHGEDSEERQNLDLRTRPGNSKDI